MAAQESRCGGVYGCVRPSVFILRRKNNETKLDYVLRDNQLGGGQK